MHQAGQQPLQQLALPDDNDRFGACSARNVVETVDGLAHPDHAVEEQRAPAEKHG